MDNHHDSAPESSSCNDRSLLARLRRLAQAWPTYQAAPRHPMSERDTSDRWDKFLHCSMFRFLTSGFDPATWSLTQLEMATYTSAESRSHQRS